MKKIIYFDELSQDAFICWLMNFAHKDHLNEDVVLTNCARIAFKNYKDREDLTVTDIKRQYKNIDVLLEVNSKYHIIIEDKTFSGQHDDQIERYRMALKDRER
ncbi:MAG: PD-(D/E)XK nuclease family protein [Veillonella sp.]|nr:PD-(D/E)XK nuclease family protein [Veillonella sp.]